MEIHGETNQDLLKTIDILDDTVLKYYHNFVLFYSYLVRFNRMLILVMK